MAGLQVWRRHNGHKQHHFVFVTVSHDVAGLHKLNRPRIKNLAGNKAGWELQIHRGRQSCVSRLPVINVPSLSDAEMHPDKKLLPGNYSVCAGHKLCKNLRSGFRGMGFGCLAQSFEDKISSQAYSRCREEECRVNTFLSPTTGWRQIFMVHRASLQKSHQYKIAEASVKTARELQAKFVRRERS